MEDKFTALLKRLENVTARLETMEKVPVAVISDKSDAVEDMVLPPFVKAFDELLSNEVASFVAIANKLSETPEVAKQAALLKQVIFGPCHEAQSVFSGNRPTST